MPIDPADKQRITGQQYLDAGIEDWRLVLDRLVARFDTGDFNSGTELVTKIAAAADEVDHHPDVDLRYPHVTVSLMSHDVMAVTQRDLRLARRISEIAAESGVSATTAPDLLEFGLDTASAGTLSPFYRALLGYEAHPSYENDLRDPADGNVNVWFQDSDSTEPDRQRWHLDVSVPDDLAEARLQAVLDAGGTLVSDDEAPAFWVVADADGNRSCICSWRGRSSWAATGEE